MTILTSDGVSHGAPERHGRGSAFRLDTACGLEFRSWTYASMKYGDEDDDERPVVTSGTKINCMTCLVRRSE